MNSAKTAPNHRLLVIDDNRSIHEDFRKILAGYSPQQTALDKAETVLFGDAPPVRPRLMFEIDSAFQGKDGAELVREAVAGGRPYAVAFVDVRMPPGWDGIETITHLWRHDPDLQVVICTAFADYSWDDIVRRLGQTESLVILKKPFDNVEVLQLAHALTRKWFLGQEARLRFEDLDRMVSQRTRELVEANENLQKQIAQKELVEGALRHSEERFSKAFRASPIALAIHALGQGNFLDVNDRFVEMTGFSREELLGAGFNPRQLFHDPAQREKLLARLCDAKPVCNAELKLLNRLGAERDTLLSMELFILGAEPHVLVLIQDITERLNLETQLRQAQKMEAVGQLAAGVAHDFNNILTIIQGHAGLILAGGNLDPETSDSLHQITAASERGAGLTRQLLAFSRKHVMQPRVHNVNDLIFQLLKMLRRLIGEHIKLQCEFTDAPLRVFADAGCLEQVIINLAVNARDAMPRGGQLLIRTSLAGRGDEATHHHPESRSGRFACVSVTDTGCGMEAKVLDHIFEPFFTTKDVGKGTGLGLATVYGILKQHDGWVEVESQPGRGTTFTFFVPITNKFIELVPRQPEPICAASRKETILVVEDERSLREMICDILGQHGYTVCPATSGVEALKIWDERQGLFDLLLTDMIMPEDLSGRALAQKLWATNPRLKVIYTSGYPMELTEESALEKANVWFLAKPYDLTKLTQVVRGCLDGDPKTTPTSLRSQPCAA